MAIATSSLLWYQWLEREEADMNYASMCLLLAAFLFLPLGACRGGEEEGFACITDQDCPPSPCACRSPSEMELRGTCAGDEGGLALAVCGGSCDRESMCPEGTTCQEERREEGAHRADGVLYDVVVFSCLSDGSGGTGGSGMRTLIDRCMESTMVYCDNGYDCRDQGWAVSAETFADFYGQSRNECLSTGIPCTTEEAYCEDRSFPGTYNPANHEACIDGQRNTNCAVDEVNLPLFPPECDAICVQ